MVELLRMRCLTLRTCFPHIDVTHLRGKPKKCNQCQLTTQKTAEAKQPAICVRARGQNIYLENLCFEMRRLCRVPERPLFLSCTRLYSVHHRSDRPTMGTSKSSNDYLAPSGGQVELVGGELSVLSWSGPSSS